MSSRTAETSDRYTTAAERGAGPGMPEFLGKNAHSRALRRLTKLSQHAQNSVTLSDTIGVIRPVRYPGTGACGFHSFRYPVNAHETLPGTGGEDFSISDSRRSLRHSDATVGTIAEAALAPILAAHRMAGLHGNLGRENESRDHG